ncbi:RagB/SusD family nutrient uptake outer membrane protein [uncultured Bacteroides sp.]|uniref:RagB/SusD family nutrient uptake outer membrane protein n=1 Tax=uncultured Bacteroides sp. TaxID=162156 RepID=UPI0025D4D133|nr:RagB/SusD family nutrient uptake outer membrane protein [uncultured Bacteroides sp.]
MKSKYILTAILFTGLGLTGCNDVLDKKNLNAVTAEQTWNDETLATAFLDKCYKDNLPDWDADVVQINGFSDETRGGEDFFYKGQLTSEGTDKGPTKEYWPYEGIYKLNVLLDNINTGSLSEDVRKKIEAQALFLRAYRYFELVKRYGGVPLVLSVQNRDETEVPREKTSVCIDRIVEDLQAAANVLPASWGSADAGRITRGAALAMKGRVLMFYASKQFNRSGDKARWQTAYDANLAAKTQLEKDGYSLNDSYDGTWKDNSDACELSKEVIFSSRYSYPARYTDINAGVRPLDYSQGATGWNQPTLDMVLAYPMADGTAPGVDTDGDGMKEPFDPTATDARGLFWLNRDPRFYKTIVTNGMVYPIVDNQYPEQRQYTYKGGEVEIANSTKTGFYSCKFVNCNVPKVDVRKYDLDWVEMRYAEVLLNLAECAAEVGNKETEVYGILKEIRKRAGITPNDDALYGLKANMTGQELIDAVLFERRIELAYEGKRFWDMRRRMIFSEPEYKGYAREIIEISLTDAKKDLTLSELVKDFASGSGDNKLNTVAYFDYFKTIVTKLDNKFQWDVEDNHYFFAIPKKHLEQNPNLEQTKGWNDGTFDPLL